MWGANTFPVRKYNSRAFHLKVRRSRLFRFFQRFPQINVGGDSARIPFVEHASHESRVAFTPKGRLRQHVYLYPLLDFFLALALQEHSIKLYYFKKLGAPNEFSLVVNNPNFCTNIISIFFINVISYAIIL